MSLADDLSGLFLFAGMDSQEILWKLALAHPTREVYRRGEVLCAPEKYRRALFVITRGECDAVQRSGEGRVVLNTLHAGDSFGVVSLYSQRDVYPTTVMARRETEVIVFNREDVERMMHASPQIAVNLITFLTGRVEFLTDRVSALTAPTVERKLAGCLLAARPAEGEPVIRLNRKRTAEALNCGRASLYRALETMENKGLIACEGAEIKLLSPEGLERILQ